MNVNWFKNQDNIAYVEAEAFIPNFAKETGILNLKEQIENFIQNPIAEGKIIQGKKRTSLKLLIPDLMFQEHLDMGENVWIYLGENQPCYCVYWPLSA